jgi:hypothetical protein
LTFHLRAHEERFRGSKMKKIMAIIRPNKLQVVKEALDEIGIPSITVTEVAANREGLLKSIATVSIV